MWLKNYSFNPVIEVWYDCLQWIYSCLAHTGGPSGPGGPGSPYKNNTIIIVSLSWQLRNRRQKQFPNEGATQTHSVRTDCHALAHRACAVSDILLVLMHPTVSCQHYSSRQWRNGRACRGLTSPSIVDVKGGILFTLSFVVWMMVRNQ